MNYWLRNKAKLLLLGWLLSTFSNPAITAANLPFNYQASYRIEHEGSYVGELKVRLEALGGDLWRFQSTTEPLGLYALFSGTHIIETSYLDLQAGGLRNLAYQYEDGKSSNQGDVVSYFDWQQQRLRSYKGDKPLEAPLTANTYDRHALTLIITQALQSKASQLQFQVVDKGKRSEIKFERRGEEDIRIGNQPLHTLKLEEVRPAGKRHSISWHAAEYDFLPVRIEQHNKGRLVTRLLLSDFKRQ